MRPAEKWREDQMNDSDTENRTLVVGLGVTGLSVARFLAARGNSIVVVDSRAEPPGLDELRRVEEFELKSGRRRQRHWR